MGAWNYWHNLLITRNMTGGANKQVYVKWSQGPEVVAEGPPPMILGWDELSNYRLGPIMADDWKCNDPRPVTDIHWWGSFIGWKLQRPPAVMPRAFHIGIWTDIPAGADQQYSHPGRLIWQNVCDSYVWNFAGIDEDPRPEPMDQETCFQFNQLLSEDEWFFQNPEQNQVYWVSIAALYDPADYENPEFYPWGWKTRPHFYNDDAVRIRDTDIWPPVVGAKWTGGEPVEMPEGVSWDLAFELTTNQPDPDPVFSADINRDGIVNLLDVGILSSQWLTAGP